MYLKGTFIYSYCYHGYVSRKPHLAHRNGSLDSYWVGDVIGRSTRICDIPLFDGTISWIKKKQAVVS